ncbi:hypothetical protein ACTMU2_19595 [Cupriavidus basilensis]
MVPLDALHPTQITVGAYHVAQKMHVTRRIVPPGGPPSWTGTASTW